MKAIIQSMKGAYLYTVNGIYDEAGSFVWYDKPPLPFSLFDKGEEHKIPYDKSKEMDIDKKESVVIYRTDGKNFYQWPTDLDKKDRFDYTQFVDVADKSILIKDAQLTKPQDFKALTFLLGFIVVAFIAGITLLYAQSIITQGQQTYAPISKLVNLTIAQHNQDHNMTLALFKQLNKTDAILSQFLATH